MPRYHTELVASRSARHANANKDDKENSPPATANRMKGTDPKFPTERRTERKATKVSFDPTRPLEFQTPELSLQKPAMSFKQAISPLKRRRSVDPAPKESTKRTRTYSESQNARQSSIDIELRDRQDSFADPSTRPLQWSDFIESSNEEQVYDNTVISINTRKGSPTADCPHVANHVNSNDEASSNHPDGLIVKTDRKRLAAVDTTYDTTQVPEDSLVQDSITTLLLPESSALPSSNIPPRLRNEVLAREPVPWILQVHSCAHRLQYTQTPNRTVESAVEPNQFNVEIRDELYPPELQVAELASGVRSSESGEVDDGDQAPQSIGVHNDLSRAQDRDVFTEAADLSQPELPSLEQASNEDHDFVEQVKRALKARTKSKTANVGRRQARRILKLLELATPPDASEALSVSGNEAAKEVESGAFFPGIIITEEEQPLPNQSIRQFLDEYYDDSVKVWIQDPSMLLSRNITPVREVSIGQLKKRFFEPNTKSGSPWNCLELATHWDEGLRPAFLNNEDCRLLTKLKLPESDDTASRRTYEPGWKEVEKWALLAQKGSLTEPHQDSHGYSTYITVNEGIMGFGWLSNPTPEERAAWRADDATYTGGRWRYKIMRPGQTVFFPCGTVHFVFRVASAGDTLAFGGHVLRCSQIVRWIQTLLEEKADPSITNEDLTVSAPAYLERVETFVKQAKKNGQVQRWGGAEAIEEFMRLKKMFLDNT